MKVGGYDDPGLAAEVEGRYVRKARTLGTAYRAGRRFGYFVVFLLAGAILGGLLLATGALARGCWELLRLGWRL